VNIQQQNKTSNPPLCENCHRESLEGKSDSPVAPNGHQARLLLQETKDNQGLLSYMIIIHLSQNKITSAYLARPEKCVTHLCTPLHPSSSSSSSSSSSPSPSSSPSILFCIVDIQYTLPDCSRRTFFPKTKTPSVQITQHHCCYCPECKENDLLLEALNDPVLPMKNSPIAISKSSTVYLMYLSGCLPVSI